MPGYFWIGFDDGLAIGMLLGAITVAILWLRDSRPKRENLIRNKCDCGMNFGDGIAQGSGYQIARKEVEDGKRKNK